MTDKFNVSIAFTPTNPSTGDKITATLSGDDVQTVAVAGTAGPFSVVVVAPDGATSTITAPAIPVTIVTSSHLSVKFQSITDTTGRTTWTVAADGLTATAIAPAA